MKAFSPEVEPLTIVAVRKESDEELYIGADSQFTDSGGLRFYQPKILVVNKPGKAIALATVGNPQIGKTEFGAWVGQY